MFKRLDTAEREASEAKKLAEEATARAEEERRAKEAAPARTEEPGAINMEVVRVRSLQHPTLVKEIDEELTMGAPIKQPGWRRWIAQAAMFATATTLVFAEVFHETYRAHRSRNDHESPRSRLDSGGADDDDESRSNPLS